MSSSVVDTLVALQDKLRHGLYLSHGPEFDYQIYVLYGTLGLSFLLILGTLAVRIKNGGFWLIRRQTSTRGTWLTPNSITCFLLLCAVYVPFLFTFARYTQLSGIYGSDLHNSMIWRCLAWTPFWCSGWIMAWTTALSPILAKPDSALARFPKTFSIICIIVPIVAVSVVVPLSFVANSSFNRLFAMFGPLDSGLTTAIAALQGGTLSLTEMAQLMLHVQERALAFEEELVFMELSWRRVWIAWSALCGFVLIFFSTATFIHFRWLGETVRRLERKHIAKYGSMHHAQGSGSGGEYAKQMHGLVWAYRSLMFTTVMTVLSCFLYTVLSITLAWKVEEVIKGSKLEEVIGLLAIYFYAVIGTITNLILFLRSFASPSTSVPIQTQRSVALQSGRNVPDHRQSKTFECRGAEFTFQIGRDPDDEEEEEDQFTVRHAHPGDAVYPSFANSCLGSPPASHGWEEKKPRFSQPSRSRGEKPVAWESFGHDEGDEVPRKMEKVHMWGYGR